MSDEPRYVIITPARDEEDYIELTLSSVIQQTVRPVEWIIVNDGSRDRTGDIAEEYARQCSWIKVLHRGDRGFRDSAGGEVDAFYYGYDTIESQDWQFIVKLDGDLSIGKDYFEKCFKHFDEDRRLGIAGGTIYNILKGKEILEPVPDFHVRGATKIYRKECLEHIGPLHNRPGWDTLDEVKANMLGWRTQTLRGVKALHHRFTGKAVGLWRNAIKNGLANYISGYHPLFMTLKCVKRLKEKPYVIASAGLFYGFLSGYLKGIPQVDDQKLVQYLRGQQMRRLLMRESIWR